MPLHMQANIAPLLNLSKIGLCLYSHACASAHTHVFLQDLACVRCRAVTSSHLRSACSVCGGDLRCTVPPSVRRTQITVFRNVAAFHCFPLLREMADWLLQDGQAEQ